MDSGICNTRSSLFHGVTWTNRRENRYSATTLLLAFPQWGVVIITELHVDWALSLSLGTNGSKLTGSTSGYDMVSAIELLKEERFFCELLCNKLDRKDDEEGNVQMEAV